MLPLSPDTSPDAQRVLIRLLRDAPPWRKLEMVAQLNAAVRVLMLEGLRLRYPEAAAVELNRHLADLVLGPELAARVYGPHKTP